MDRLRRSLRIPFRRGSHPSNYSATITTPQAAQLSSRQRHNAGGITVDSDSGSPRTSTVPTTPPDRNSQPRARGGVSDFARTLLGRSMRVGRQQRPIQRQEDARVNNIRVSRGGKADKNGFAQFDEIAVRSSACSFLVKYLGSCEVFESRGIQVCESALQHLRARKQYTKALLYVSGDAVRVVDQGNSRGLIVDQTIEKVSFCAPDRHNSKGFAYICREGATRRWMCHGFQSMRESGERISHAVGCAFSVCLEKKRKRDAETAAFKSAQSLHAQSSRAGEDLNAAWNEPLNADSSPASSVSIGLGLQGKGGAGGIPVNNGDLSSTAHRINPAYSSFRRQLSIAERRRDPQTAIVNIPGPPLNGTTAAMPRSVSLGEREARTGVSVDPSAIGAAVSRSRPMGTLNASLLLFEDGSHLDGEGGEYTSREGAPIPFRRYNSLGSHNGIAIPIPTCRSLYGIKMLFNEPIYEGDLDESYSNEPPQASQTSSSRLLPAFPYNPTVTFDRPEPSPMIKELAAPTTTDSSNHQAEEWLNEAFHASLHFVRATPLTASDGLEYKAKGAPVSTQGAVASPRPPATWTSFDDTNSSASLKNSQAPMMKLENGTSFDAEAAAKVAPHARIEKTIDARSDQGESMLRKTTTAETREKTTKLGTTLGALFVGNQQGSTDNATTKPEMVTEFAWTD